jgi:hypothetical protein
VLALGCRPHRQLPSNKKNKPTKITSWTIRADAVRKLDRGEPEPQAPASGTSEHSSESPEGGTFLISGLEKLSGVAGGLFLFDKSAIAVGKRKSTRSLRFPGIARPSLALCIFLRGPLGIAGFVPTSGDAVRSTRNRVSATDSAPSTSALENRDEPRIDLPLSHLRLGT